VDAVVDFPRYKMKFGKYLGEKQRPEWAGKYVDYGSLKDLIKEAFKEHQESVSLTSIIRLEPLEWK
jgi:SPX domain protein involved in polyphosphate accumulation